MLHKYSTKSQRTTTKKKQQLYGESHFLRGILVVTGGVIFNYPAAEMQGGVTVTPPDNKMAADVTITLFY